MKTVSLALALLLTTPSLAAAADTIFGMTTIWPDVVGGVRASCWIFNAGSKPVTIRSAALASFDGSAPPVPIDDEDETCTDAPLEPLRTCNISGTLGAYAGGYVVVKGSTKNLRGDCTIQRLSDDVTVFIVPMR